MSNKIGDPDLKHLKELDERLDQDGFSWQHLDYIVLRDTLGKRKLAPPKRGRDSFHSWGMRLWKNQ